MGHTQLVEKSSVSFILAEAPLRPIHNLLGLTQNGIVGVWPSQINSMDFEALT